MNVKSSSERYMLTRNINKVLAALTSISTASVLQSVVIFSYIYFMSHFADVSEYALYRKYFYVVDFTTALSLFGINTLLLRKDKDYIRGNIVNSLLIVNTLSTFILIVFSLTRGFSWDVFLQLFIFLILNTLYQIVTGMIIRFQKKALYFSLTSINFVIVAVCMVFLTCNDLLTYHYLYIVRTLSLLLYIVPFFFNIRREIARISFIDVKSSLSLFKEASPIGFGVMLGSCTLYVDKFVASLMSDYDLAVYANASADIPFVGVAITTMSAFYIPLIHNEYKKNMYHDAATLLSDLFLFGWYLGVMVFTLLFCNAEKIVTLLYSAKYIESVSLFKIFCCSYLLRIISYTYVIVSLELEKIIIKRMIYELLLQLFLSILLFKLFGIYGLAASVILVLACWSVPYNIYYFARQLKTKIRLIIPYKKMICFLLKCFIPYAGLGYVLEALNLNTTLIFASTFILFCLVNYKEINYVITKLR